MFELIFTWESIYNFVFNLSLFLKSRGIEKKESIIKNKIYNNSLIDRIIIYQFVYFLPYIYNYKNLLFPIISFPIINNLLFDFLNRFYYIRKYNKIKKEYIIYLKVKIYYCLIKYLEPSSINISYMFDFSDQVFYNVIKDEHFYILFKNLLFTYLMYILKNNENTYYYYKTIQLSYYYSSKYMFKIISPLEAKEYMKNIFLNKNYQNLNSIEYSNSIYSLIISKKANDEKKFWDLMKINILYYICIFNILWGLMWIFHVNSMMLPFMYNFLSRIVLLYFSIKYIIYKKYIFKTMFFISILLISLFSISIYGDLILCLYLLLYNLICLYISITYYFIRFKMKNKIEKKDKVK